MLLRAAGSAEELALGIPFDATVQLRVAWEGGSSEAITATTGALPDGALPEGGLPDGVLPEGALPDGALPDGALPDGGPPEGALPEGALPEGAPPEGAFALFGFFLAWFESDLRPFDAWETLRSGWVFWLSGV